MTVLRTRGVYQISEVTTAPRNKKITTVQSQDKFLKFPTVKNENATICIVLVLADVRLLVLGGPFVPGPNNPLTQFSPHLTFSVKIEF